MPILTFHAHRDTVEIAGAIREHGCAIIEDATTLAIGQKIHAELQEAAGESPRGDDDFSGHLTRRTGSIIERSPTAHQLIEASCVLDTVKSVLSQSGGVQLHASQLIAIEPGESAQVIHRDQWAFDFFPFPKETEVHCGAMWALSDFTAENGATRVVPGSHLFDDFLEIPTDETEAAEMKPGSVLLYTGSLYHGGGANQSDNTRLGLNLTYSSAWLRQEENQYLSVPREVAKTLPESLLRLIGYEKGAYALGYWGDLRDPMEIVRPDLAVKGLQRER